VASSICLSETCGSAEFGLLGGAPLSKAGPVHVVMPVVGPLAHSGDEISVAALANTAGMEVHTFLRRFQKATGPNPQNMLRRCALALPVSGWNSVESGWSASPGTSGKRPFGISQGFSESDWSVSERVSGTLQRGGHGVGKWPAGPFW